MSQYSSIAQLRNKHEELYDIVIKQDDTVLKSPKGKALHKEIEDLIKFIEKLSLSPISLDDYEWLNDISIKWQIVLSSYFNIPRIINIAMPKKYLYKAFRFDRALTEAEVENIVKRHSEYSAFWRIREFGRKSTPAEIEWDKKLSEQALASEIIDGKINFASRICPNSYWRLEMIWLRDVKLLNAYFIWLHSKLNNEQYDSESNFLKACEHLRGLLVNKGMKAILSEFGGVNSYLKRYIDDEGRLDKTRPETMLLISKKASRIAQKDSERGVCTDDVKNWIEAELYVHMFYENITPAVELNDKEAVLTVLKSFQYSKSLDNHYHVINCFETAIAIYFLDPDIVHRLWEESTKYPIPFSCFESVIRCDEIPKNLTLPKCMLGKLSVRDNCLVYKGVMKNIEKKELVDHIKSIDALSVVVEQAIEDMFVQSRLIHRETTL